MFEPLNSRYLQVMLPPGSSILRLRRTSVVVDNIEVVADVVQKLEQILPPEKRKTLCLLMDMRDGPGLTDDNLEVQLNKVIPRLIAGFKRRAVLLRTEFGKLQAMRKIKEAQEELRAFTNEDEALDYLLEVQRPNRSGK